jgi:cysteine synthase A
MASLKNVHNLAEDPTKNVVIFINDYYDEYGKAFQKLASRLGRELRGIMLVDKTLKGAGQNLPDTSGMFEEIVCDFTSDAELRATLKQLEDNLLLVSCSAESSQMAFQRVLPHVPYIPGPSESSLEWATHKGKMRELLGAYDAKLVPKVQPVASAANEEIRGVLANLDFPMIIKPTGLSDSALVTKVHNEHELRTTLREAFAALHDTYNRNRGNGDPGIIVEEFMEGDLYSIDGYVNESGKVWLLPLLRSKSAYHMGLEGFYIYQTETYHELTEEEDAAGKKAAEDAVHAIGLRSSIAHVELYKTDDGWKIIELGARPGAMRQEIYEVSYGVDHALNELLIKIGLEPELGNGHLTHSMVFKVYPEAEGEVDLLEGIDEANRHPSVYKIFQFVQPGDKILPITQGGSVAVQGVLYGSDVNRLREEVGQVRSAIKIKTAEQAGHYTHHKENRLQPVA